VLTAPGENHSKYGKDAVQVAIGDELAKGFGWIELSNQQSFHIPASDFHNRSVAAIWGKSENFTGEFPGPTRTGQWRGEDTVPYLSNQGSLGVTSR
jgi:hypothetical protein